MIQMKYYDIQLYRKGECTRFGVVDNNFNTNTVNDEFVFEHEERMLQHIGQKADITVLLTHKYAEITVDGIEYF